MIPAAISHLQESFFRTANTDGDLLENTSTHPCHRLSIPAARLFWCRHCMQIFEDPITRWRHSKTCLQSSSGKVRKDKDGSTMQVFLSANNVSELRREHNRSRVISRSVGPGHSPGTELRCFICKSSFVSIDEMRVHVRTPCRKRPKAAAPKNKLSALPPDAKTEIPISNTASEIIYIKDGHQTVISLASPFTTEIIEPVSETPISSVETVVPDVPKSEEVPKQPKDQTENKENNIRKRKRILPKEVDDRPNHKTSNSQKSEQQIAMGLPIKSDDVKDVLEDFESPPIKISKMTNKDPEDETSETKVRAKPLQIKEELSQLLTTEKKDNQLFLGVGEHIANGVVTEQVSDEDVLLKAPVSPVERIVTGDAAEARLKDLFTTMEMLNKTKSSPSSKQTKTVSSPRKSKTGSPMKIRNNSINKFQVNNLEKDEKQLCVSQEETIDTSGLLLYMPPINAGSVTLPDPLLDLRNGLPAEMLLDETTNMKPHIPFAWEAFNVFVPSDIMEETKLPSHIFDGDLLPSQIHSEVLFEEIIDEKEHPPLVDNRLAEELVSVQTNLMVSAVGISNVEGEVERFAPVGQVSSVEEVSTEVVTPVKENAQIFASIEEMALPVTIDHVEEIAHTPLVTPVEEISSVSVGQVMPLVEETTLVETVTSVLETISIKTVPSVEEASNVETLTPVLETTPVETLPPTKETIPVETLASVLEGTKIETVPKDKETTHIEAVPLVQEPTPIETISPVQEPAPIEAVPSVHEPTPTEAVLPAIETVTLVTDTEINTAEKENKFVEGTPSLKTLEENQEISLGESESEQVNNKGSVLPIPESLEMSNQSPEEKPAEKNVEMKTKDTPNEEEEASVVEKTKSETKHKSTKLFKCKACSNTFKTPQALQKHSRFPCILKHTRSLSQKILRPKQPCLKIEKKPLKKRMVKPSRRPSLMIPIMPITRCELIRPAVPRRPKRFSRRKKRRSFFIDEQNRILPYVNVLMSELSDKDRFFYKLGMLNQCRKIPSSETTTTTAPNAEAPAVATSGDSAERAPSTLEFPVIVTESTYPPEIGPLSVVAESQGIAYSASPAVAAACVSDKENLSAMAKGLCLTLPTLEKMEDHQFHDPNCISPSHVKPVPDDDPPRDPSGVTGQSVQSPCWEAAPRLAQLPGVTQIVRVTSANPSSAGLLNGIQKSPAIPESDLPNGKSLALSNSRLHCKKISKEMVNDFDMNIRGRPAALRHEKSEEHNSKGETCFEAAQEDTTNFSDDAVNKKIRPNSVRKVKFQKTRDRKKKGVESKKQLKTARIILPDKTHLSRSCVVKNSINSKLNHSQTAKNNVIKSVKNHNHTNNRNQKCTNIEIGEKKHRSLDTSVSNSRKIISSLSKNITCLSSKKVTANRNSAEPAPSSKKVPSNQKSPMTTSTSCKKGSSSQKSPMTTPTSSKKGSSSQKSPMTTPTSSKKVPSNQKSPVTTPTSSKKVPSNQKSPMSSKKVPSNQKSPMTTPISSKKIPSNQKTHMITPTSSKKVPSNQKSSVTPTSTKKVPPNQKSPMTTPNSSKKVPSNQKTLTTTPTSCKKVASKQKSPMATSPSKQRSVSLKKHIWPQQKTRRKDRNNLRAVKIKASSKLTISTRSSPLKKARSNQALESLHNPKSMGSEIKNRKRAIAPRRQENRICKPGKSSLNGQTVSKSLQIKQRNSSHINISPQNLKKVIPNGETHTKNCRVAPSKDHSTETLHSLSEKVSISSEKSSPQGSKGQKQTKPLSEMSDVASPSRVTRRTQKFDNTLADSKEVQKPTTATSSKRNNKSLPESKCSDSPHKDNLKVPPEVSQPIKNCLDHGECNSLPEKRVGNKPEVSKNQSQTNLAAPISVTKQRKNKSPVRKSPSRNQQKLGSPSTLSSTNDHSNTDSIPYLRNRSISKSDTAKNDTAPLNNNSISKSLANAAYSMSSRSKSKLCSESITNPVSVDKESVSDKNISSSPPIHHSTERDLPTEDNSTWLSQSVSKECNEINQENSVFENIHSPCLDSQTSSGIGCSNILQVAEIPAVSCGEQEKQEFGNERSVKMTESADKSVLAKEKLKGDQKPSPRSGECYSESPSTELLSRESLLKSVSSDPLKTEATTVVNVINKAVATTLSCGVDNGEVTNSSPAEYKTPSDVLTTETLNPRISIATQTDSSFIKEVKTVSSDSCDNVEKNEPPSVSINPDPTPPFPSSPTTNTTTNTTPVDNIPPPLVLSEEVVQENLHLDPNVLPSPQEIVINDTPLSPVSLSPPGATCEVVQGDSGLQEDNTDASNVLLQQSVPDPLGAVATESSPLMQQLVLDNTTDPNVLVQYLNSLDPSLLPQEVTFVIIQGTPGEPLHLTDDHNFIIEQAAFSEQTEQGSDSHSVIYTMQPPHSDITTEAECIITDSS